MIHRRCVPPRVPYISHTRKAPPPPLSLSLSLYISRVSFPFRIKRSVALLSSMASDQSSSQNLRKPLYPQVLDSNPEKQSPFLSNSRSSLYPSVEMVGNLFPDSEDAVPPPPVAEETLLRVPGAILHLIDRERSVHLAAGDLSVVRIREGENTVAVLARVSGGDGGDAVQWPLALDEAAVKLDDSHYFFSLHVPGESGEPLNYGLTFASKGQDALLKDLDEILETYNTFSIQKVEKKSESEVLDGSVERNLEPGEVMEAGSKEKAIIEERSTVYWTTLAPNVEDYSGSVAKVIAMGSGQLIKGILWCGDVTADQLKWGEDFLKRRTAQSSSPKVVSKDAMKRMKRVKRVTKMSENVATGILSGVVKVSGFFTSPIVNSKAGKKFFSLLPGEIVLASLDGFGKICDAVEVAGKNVLQTTSVVTTGVTSHRYGEQAAEITNEGLGAAGHAIGTAWAVFKIRKALNPKNSMKPSTLAKTAAKLGIKSVATDLKKGKGETKK